MCVSIRGVLTENLNTKQFADRGSNGAGGTGCQMKYESEMQVRKGRDTQYKLDLVQVGIIVLDHP